MTEAVATGRRVPSETLIPSLLLAALGVAAWLAVFAGDELQHLPPYFEPRDERQFSGLEIAGLAVGEAFYATENQLPTDNGLFAGPPERITMRYEPNGEDSIWTALIYAPLRFLPNTPGEFRGFGLVVVQMSAYGGRVAGVFATGRLYGWPEVQSLGLLQELGISPDGFVEMPLHLVWPQESEWILL